MSNADISLVFTVCIPRSALAPSSSFSRKRLPDRVRDYAVAALAAQHPTVWDAAVTHARRNSEVASPRVVLRRRRARTVEAKRPVKRQSNTTAAMALKTATKRRRMKSRTKAFCVDIFCNSQIEKGGVHIDKHAVRTPLRCRIPRLPLLMRNIASAAKRMTSEKRVAAGFYVGTFRGSVTLISKFCCRLCGATCASQSKIDNHVLKAHCDNISLFVCDVSTCSAKFATAFSLRQHTMRRHIKQK